MVDYTKCNGTDCPKRDTCYRYTAPVSPDGQSWGKFEPYCLTDNLYEYYMED